MSAKKKIRCFAIMVIGNVFMGMGGSLFKMSGLGNDPWTGMLMGVSDAIGMVYAHFSVAVNLGLFVLQVLLGRRLIGAGTVVNGLGLGYIVTFWMKTWASLFPQPELLVVRLILMAVGMVITSFGLSLYQAADMGVAPYDSLSMIMTERLKKIPYFWNRVFTDGVCTVICWISGGIVGVGTLVTVFALGPFISFFHKYCAEKLIGAEE